MEQREFTYRLDFYWQSIAFYAVAMIIYGVARGVMDGTFINGTVEVVLFDPLLILLALFVAGSGVAILFMLIIRRSIVVSDEAIIFKNRFRERRIPVSHIKRIRIGREKIIKVRGSFKLVKIQLATRRRLVRIRTGSYNNEHALVESLYSLKGKVNAAR